MSNNNSNNSNSNPIGHIAQPTQNPSWNPLQIPSYIPRQPQLAHMSNERPMVRSPLTWHAPAPPPDAIYNFMSANHKTLEHHQNPLLQPYVRGPSPFDSMDLSLQSSRSASSPLNKGGVSGGSHAGMSSQHEYAAHKQQQQQHSHSQQHQSQSQSHQQQQQQQQSQMHAPNSFPIHNLSTNSSSTISHSQQQQQQQQQHASMSAPAPHHPHGGIQSVTAAPPPSSSPAAATSAAPNTKYLNSNGNECETMLPPASAAGSAASGGNGGAGVSGSPSGTTSGNNNNVSTGPNTVHQQHYLREADAARLSESYAKMSQMSRGYESELQSKSIQKPVELVNKDCSYPAIMSNKMPPHQQQQHVSPKKQSPLRNYHAHQQQQQHSPYSNPPSAVKRNGPHTPPMPQSPVMHQQQQPPPQQQPAATTNSTQQQLQQQQHPPTMHGNNAVMDYNQLHLQQQQNSYTHHQQQHQQQQQQQQHLPPHLQQQHLQHYAHHHHHHLQQQQQQHQQQQHHSQQHMHPQQQQLAPQHQQQQAQQHLHQQHHSPMHQQQQQHLSHLTNLDAYSSAAASAARNESKVIADALTGKPTITDLTTATPPANFQGGNMRGDSSGLPDTAESPDAAAGASSNDESLDSNSNSSGCRLRRIRRQPKIVRMSSNESGGDGEELSEQQQQQVPPPPPTNTSSSNTRSPKTSPEQQRKSPPKTETNSPRSSQPSPEQIATTTSIATTVGPELQRPSVQTYLQSPEKAQSMENGRSATATAVAAADEVETIDKIAEMIAKTSSEASSSYSRFKNIEPPPPDLGISSPKTKKQRQALKLRNAAEQNSNSNCSAHSYNDNTAAAASDNAVLADELRKDDDVINVTPTVATIASTSPITNHQSSLVPATDHLAVPIRPLSPQSNSRSSSSSSSSSSHSSNSSHSSRSNISKSQTAKNVAATAAAKDANNSRLIKSPTATKLTVLGKENMREGVIQSPNNNNNNNNNNRDIVDAITEDGGSRSKEQQDEEVEEVPLNLNSKKCDECVVETSPTKSACFEEVENKLEEMFAGIEDEPAVPPHEDDDDEEEQKTGTDSAEVVNDLSLALELAKETKNKKQKIDLMETTDIAKTLVQLPLRVERPPPTKAAKKSTVPSPVKPLSPQPTPASPSLPSLLTAQKKPSTPSPPPKPAPQTLPKRITPPRRRLSVVMDPANLRITIESANKEKTDQEKRSKTKQVEQADNKKLIVHLDDERPSTSAAAAAALASSDLKSSPKNEKPTRGGKSARGGTITKSKRGGGGKASTKNNASSSKQKQQKQNQRRRKNASSSEDETAPTPPSLTREPPSVDPKYKSPFILVKRDGSISVINAPTAAGGGADDIGGEKNKTAKAKKAAAAAYAHDRKNIRGLHLSTLSNRYDADTTDSTWICVFCKHGPHKLGLGDLFGPYLVSIECSEYKTAVRDSFDLDATFVSKRRRVDMVQHNPRNLPVVPATLAAQQQQLALRVGMNKKKKKSVDEPPLPVIPAAASVDDPLDCNAETLMHTITFRGMCKVSDSSYEVWLHEDCIVWAPDVFLVGARVMGLDAAVWNSTLYNCVLCGKSGAIVCCLQRECKAPAHVPCARAAHWSLSETTLKVHCNKHAPSMSTSSLVALTSSSSSSSTRMSLPDAAFNSAASASTSYS